MDGELAILRVHDAEADGVGLAGLEAKVFLRLDAAGDVVGVEVLPPIDRGAFPFPALGRNAEGVDAPLDVFESDIRAEDDGAREPGNGAALVGATEGEEIGDLDLVSRTSTGKPSW